MRLASSGTGAPPKGRPGQAEAGGQIEFGDDDDAEVDRRAAADGDGH